MLALANATHLLPLVSTSSEAFLHFLDYAKHHHPSSIASTPSAQTNGEGKASPESRRNVHDTKGSVSSLSLSYTLVPMNYVVHEALNHLSLIMALGKQKLAL
jgi:hypothetical protein